MAKKYYFYIHKITGEIVKTTKQSAKKLPPEYEEVEFTTNDQGKRVMRIHLEGATVDISEREEVPQDVYAVTN